MEHEMNSSIQIAVHTLNELLEKNGEAWAPVLCEWSVESLGQISSNYTQSASISGSSSHSTRKLNELLGFWLQILPTRMLMNIYRYCLKSLIDRGSESCMDSLLVTSARYAPNFDWVVADIGSTFPSEIINRVLSTGFREFANQQWGQQPMEDEQPKMKSVVRILEHLALRHGEGVRKAMVDLFQSPGTADSGGQVKVILFIMQLLSDSPVLTKVSTTSFISILDNHQLNQLYSQFSRLPSYKSKLETVCSLAVHLICQSSEGSFQLIQLLLGASDTSSDSPKSLERPVREILSKVLKLVLQDLLRIAMRKGPSLGERKENGVVTELKLHYNELCAELLKKNNAERSTWILTLMKIICVRGSASSVLGKLLMDISEQSHILLYLELYTFISAIIPVILQRSLEYCFAMVSDGEVTNSQIRNLLKNLWRLLSRNVEANGAYEVQNSLQKILWSHIKDLTIHIRNVNPCPTASELSVEILSILLVSPVPLALETERYSLSLTLVSYFFWLLHKGYVNNDAAMKSCRRALVSLAQTSETFAVLCQLMLESSVTQANAILFGRRTEELKFDEDGAPVLNHLCSEQRVSLLSQHRSHVASASVVGFTPIVVETGVVGSGPKKKKSCPLSKSAQASNNECISLLVHRCCCKTGSSGSVEGGAIYSTHAAFDEDKLLVLGSQLFQAVTSCMPGSLLHADYPWPEPNFRKYTMERDLRIFTFLDEHPFAWNMLNLLATTPRALWKCSLILRSVAGALLRHWEASRDSTASQSETHLKHSIKLIETLGKGQLLPEPLCWMSELFHVLGPYEVFLLLRESWKFIHEHPLQPNCSFNRDFFSEGVSLQTYLATVQSILHANITTMGHLYARFVPENQKIK